MVVLLPAGDILQKSILHHKGLFCFVSCVVPTYDPVIVNISAAFPGTHKL